MQGFPEVRCTVFGGQGFIGRHLVRYLESVGCTVTVPARGNTNWQNQSLGHVFYCVGLTADFRTRPFDTVRAHVTLLSELLEHADFDSFLYLSSTRIYSKSVTTIESDSLTVSPHDPSDLYNLSKLLGESLCMSSGRQMVKVARLSNVVGAGMGNNNLVGQLIQSAKLGLIRLNTHPESAKDYIFVDDVTRVLWEISKCGRVQIYNVASGVQICHRQWLSALREATGCNIEENLNAPYQSFPPIDIGRIRNEFGFVAEAAINVLPLLLKTPDI